MKVRLEYVWIDGYTPEPNLRSKIKIVDYNSIKESFLDGNFPVWNFDGSSTLQAETGSSDCILKPVRHYFKDIESTVYVLCEVLNSDGSPHESNKRSSIGEGFEDLWFGFEQEYTIYRNGRPLGFPKNGYPEPQGKYYCGVGNGQVDGREFVDNHMEMCIKAGIEITGTNAEVLLGQWEFQVFSQGKEKAGDDLWMARYILMQMSEEYGF